MYYRSIGSGLSTGQYSKSNDSEAKKKTLIRTSLLGSILKSYKITLLQVGCNFHNRLYGLCEVQILCRQIYVPIYST